MSVKPFQLNNGILHAEQVPLTRIAAEFGTPAYVYSRAALESAYSRFAAGFAGTDHLVCFAVKSNPSLAVLNLFARLGAGFDIVSGGELARVLAAGGDPAKVVFSGVGKTADEMEAALNAGIFCFNVESASELERLSEVAARLGKVAPVSLRVNPNVDAKTHPYISTGLKNNKFGVAYEEAFNLYQRAASLPNIAVHGVDCHIGSQLTELSPFLDAFDRVLVLVDQLEAAGIRIAHIDLGGGSVSAMPMRFHLILLSMPPRCGKSWATVRSSWYSSLDARWSAMRVPCSPRWNISSTPRPRILPLSMPP